MASKSDIEPTRRRYADADSDIPAGNWVDRYLPGWARPYARLARLDRPIGSWLLLFPGWWAIALAWTGWKDAWLFAAFGIGAVVMRGAGCTINDIWDRHYDAEVARTRTRPLPSGQVTVAGALGFFVLQLALGAAILFSFNPFAIWVGIASLSLVVLYPLAKRVTHWPQFVLGLAFNWGALLGWAAVRGDLSVSALLLYVGGIFWTLGYDTIYAHQDRPDDPRAGVKSSALVLGNRSKPWLYGFYGAASLLFAASGLVAGLGWVFLALLLIGAAQLIWQVWDCDLDNARDCLAKFQSNRLFGWLMLAAILIARALG